ncbi:hypothetical protein EMGBS15_08090 [Filimonas sp.]|nr:hypothetical protein EMGBS15_08090 [Filimonas sp.]
MLVYIDRQLSMTSELTPVVTDILKKVNVNVKTTRLSDLLSSFFLKNSVIFTDHRIQILFNRSIYVFNDTAYFPELVHHDNRRDILDAI